MLDHFSHSEPVCPTTDQVRLFAGFDEPLERLGVKLDAPILATTSAGGIQVSAVVQGRGVVVVEAGPLFRLRQSSCQAPLAGWVRVTRYGLCRHFSV